MPSKRNWFLKDEPLSSLQAQDRFSHNAYVNILSRAVDEVTPPFTFGVFGAWGVGKSSIVNELSDRIRQGGSKTRAVTIDVWKYSNNALRRQFLFDLQEELHRQKALPCRRDYVREVYEEQTAEISGKQRFDLSRLSSLAIPLVLTFLVTLFAILLLQVLDIPNPVLAVLGAFIAPSALFLVSESSRSVIVVSKDTITRPVYFSEDQFERKFEEIVEGAKCDKLVIIVDNLDRCSHELVFDTLSTIKTFLEPKSEGKCIFVIPCDDNAIRQHVRAAYRSLGDEGIGDSNLGPDHYATEYLRKFFSGSIRIDPFLLGEIESYVEYLLGQMKLTEDVPPDEINILVQMVGFLFRKNPRQLKQYLNNLTSKYLLTKEREAGSTPQISPPISANKLFLAKVVAIETRFPDIFEEFRNDDNLFGEVQSAAVTPGRVGETKTLLNNANDWELLESFLRTTGHVVAENPKAFFRLKQSEQEARIPNYTEFDEALRQGDVERVLKAYDDGNDETNAAQSDVLVQSISDWSQRGYNFYALNAVRVAVAVRDFQTSDGRKVSAEAVRALATAPGLLQGLHQLRNPDALLEMAGNASPIYGDVVRDVHIEQFTNVAEELLPGLAIDDQLQDSIAKSIVNHIASLSGDQKNRMRTAISSWNSLRPELLEILTSSQEAKEAFIESTTLTKAVRDSRVEDFAAFAEASHEEDEYDYVFSALLRCQDLGDSALGNGTARKLTELLEYSVNQGNDSLSWYTSRVAVKLATLVDMADEDHLGTLVPYFYNGYGSLRDDQRPVLVEFLCRQYGRANDGDRENIDSILTDDFIPLGSGERITWLLRLHGDLSFSGAPWERICERLSRLLTTELDDTEASNLMESIDSTLVPEDLGLFKVIVEMILLGPEVERSVPLVEQAIAVIPVNEEGRKLASSILEGTLSLSDHAADPGTKRTLMELALKHHDLHTQEFRAKLNDHILELIVQVDDMGEVGYHTLELGYANGAISEDDHIAVLRGFADWLIEQPGMGPLPKPIPEMLEGAVNRRDSVLMGRDRREAMVRWLSELQGESLDADEREQTLKHLVSFGRLPSEVLQVLIPKLVCQAQNPSDERTPGVIVDALLALYFGNDPLNEDQLSGLNEYRRSLRKGDASQKTLGRKLYRKMRDILRDAGQVAAG